MNYKFNRLELAGSLGDLGILLPLAIGMILVNGVDPVGVLFSVGLFYILSGAYYGVTVPVQPMKVIAGYAIATGIGNAQILASGLLMGVLLLVIGLTGLATFIGRYVPKPVIRGVQLSTGTLLMAQGVRFILGTSKFQILQQSAEPFLAIQTIGPLSLGIPLGILCGIITLVLLDNKKFPAGLVVVLLGLILGLLLGNHEGLGNLKIRLNLPTLMPFGMPSYTDFTLALVILVAPQMPMTLGNAVIANADLTEEYFGESAKRVTYSALCISMALANIGSFILGGMPLCHGAGGLAAHYRFGARTAGSNLMIGMIFIFLALFLGRHALPLLSLIPLSVLGVLLVFAGSQLSLMVLDIKKRKDLFVCLLVLGITLASNLAAGFLVGIALAYALKSEKWIRFH